MSAGSDPANGLNGPLTIRRVDTLAVAAAASGFAALTYQAVWQRVLSQLLGADTVSVAIVVGAFMAGLGIGSLTAASLIRCARRPARAYAMLEIAIGVCGAISVPALRSASETFSPWAAGSLAADAFLNLGLLLLPIFLMGMTSPLMVQIGKNTIADFGRRTGVLYGANVLGAALGASVSGLVLIELLGLWGTCLAACVLNTVAAVLVWPRDAGRPAGAPIELVVAARTGSARESRLLLVAVGCLFLGFASLALQMVFFRVLANYFTLSALVFPVVLTSFLVLMSAGQGVGGWLADRWGARNGPMVMAILVAASALLLAAAISFPPAQAAPLGALVFSPSVAELVRGIDVRIGDPNLLVAFAFSTMLMTAVVPQSALFPVVVKAVTDRIVVGGQRFAQVYGAFTAGNLLGALATGLLIFERIGLTGALWMTIVAAASGVSLVALATAGLATAIRVGALAFSISALAGATLPSDYWLGFSAGRYRPVATVEGRSGVVSIVPTDRFYTLIDIFRTESASAITRPPVAGEQYEAWRWNFSDLFALDPGFRPRRVLLIGIGHGYLPLTLLEYDFIEKIVIVDISAEIVGAVRNESSSDLRRIFSDPRIEIVVADGRRYLQAAAARGERFDLIQNRINEPWRAGGGALFTVEFFGLMKRSLNPGGYVATRHMTGYAVNGLQVFPCALWTRGSYHMYFGGGHRCGVDVAIVGADIDRAFFSAYPGRAVPRSERATVDLASLTADDFTGLPVNTDDRPVFEYFLIDDLFGGARRRLRAYLDRIPLATRRVPVQSARE